MTASGSIEYLDSAPDVVALRCTGRFTRATLDPLMARVNTAMARFGKVHLYCEVHEFGGIALADVVHYLGQALPFFGKLDGFGRIAVVSDQAWIRHVAQLESAILPYITYRTFPLAEAAVALAWVKGG